MSHERSPWPHVKWRQATTGGLRRRAAAPKLSPIGLIPPVLCTWLMLVAGAGGCDRANGGGTQDELHAHGATDGHAHGPGVEGLDPIAVTLFTEKLELFMEYPHLQKGVPAQFLAHFSVLATGEPIRKGSLIFEVTPTGGPAATKVWEAPKRDGLFVPEWTFDSSGTYRLRLLVESPQVQDIIDVGEIVVHADAHEAEHAAGEPRASALADSARTEVRLSACDAQAGGSLVPFLMEQQWKIGMRLGQAGERTLVERLAIPAQIMAPQGASAAVSPPIAGRLLPPPDGRLPRVGEQVKADQILAMIEPPLPVTDMFQLSANRAQIQALETELALRELELDAKALEVDRALIQSRARLDYARRASERVAVLRDKGVGTEQQYDEALQNVQLAEAEFAAAQAMQRSYEEARSRLAKLRSQAIPVGLASSAEETSHRMPLLAPISGEIVAVAHIEGEHLDAAHQEVFRIVNVDHVWVTGSISEFDLARLAHSPGASLTLPAYPDRRIDILAAGGRLVHVGKVVDSQTRTVALIYELPNREGLFRVGMFAEIHVETRRAVDAVAISEEAIVMDHGRPNAFVLIEGESFQRRELELGVRDSGFVEVKSGIENGERVVIKGAYAMKLAARSPASFGHGHVH